MDLRSDQTGAPDEFKNRRKSRSRRGNEAEVFFAFAYAFELAQVSVQIGFLQWRRDNGFDDEQSPVLQNLDGFQNEDALLVPHFRSKARTLKEAQADEHGATMH